ncbi:MAG: hypothetical protein M3362_18225 [Acidobacteriota bacterium]|nr:hypothetical protein [Acidobacteriota bacterium]
MRFEILRVDRDRFFKVSGRAFDVLLFSAREQGSRLIEFALRGGRDVRLRHTHSGVNRLPRIFVRFKLELQVRAWGGLKLNGLLLFNIARNPDGDRVLSKSQIREAKPPATVCVLLSNKTTVE